MTSDRGAGHRGQNLDADLDLWRRAEILFEAALDWPPAQRGRFLERACGRDSTLRRAVESLLRHDEESPDFLEKPILAPAIGEGSDEALEESDGEGLDDRWIGRTLGAYRLVRRLGAGGMGVVFLAERTDGEVDQQVAVKILHDANFGGAFLRALRRERQILVRLDHPHIARAFDGGTTEEGLPFVVLEYLDGLPITEYCDTGRLGVAERLELFRKVLGAVDYAHRHLVVHRDLKPSNILVNRAGEPKLLDFGIAKLLDEPRLEERTQTQDRFLTPSYASPEQMSGEPASTASDVYALGVLLHELLTGLRPVDVGTKGEDPSPSSAVTLVETSTAGGDAPPIRAELRGTTPEGLRRQLKGDLDAIVGRCLESSPHDRYRSASDLEEDLRRHVFGLPVLAQAPRWTYRLGKFVRRHRLGVALASLAVAALLAAGVQIVRQSYEVARERDLAEEAREEAEEVTTFLTEAIQLSDPYYRPDLDLEPGVDVTVREVLEYSASKIEDRFVDRPTLQARLLHTIGTVYGSLSRPEESEALHRKALELRRQRVDERPLELVESLNGLVFIYVDSGRLELAAEPVAEAIALSRGAAEAGLVHLSESLTNGGMLAFFRGELEAAEQHLREALDIRRAALPPDHQGQILGRTYLARILTRRGSLDEAESLLDEAMAICLEAEGKDHARYTSVAGDLAWLLTVKGEHAKAEAYYRDALEILNQKFGPDHSRTLEARGALGMALVEAGDLPQAEEILRDNIARRQRVRPDDTYGAALAINNLALILMSNGRPQDAEPLFRQGLQLLEASGEQGARDINVIQRNLARALLANGRAAEAEPLYLEALATLRKEQAEGTWRYGSGLSGLAGVLLALDRLDEALETASQGEAVLVEALPEGHVRIANVRRVRGAVLTALGRYDEAEAALLESYAVLEKVAEAEPNHFRRVRSRLVELYDAWGRPELAGPYRDGV
ncbi:MAG: tetratricopeptide repeat protein [Acidobacteriota bacterium]